MSAPFSCQHERANTVEKTQSLKTVFLLEGI